MRSFIKSTALLSGVTAAPASSAPVANDGMPPSVSYSLSGTGALTATVLYEGRNVPNGAWGLLATTNMTGDDLVGDIAATLVQYAEYRVRLTAITGTGAALTAVIAG